MRSVKLILPLLALFLTVLANAQIVSQMGYRDYSVYGQMNIGSGSLKVTTQSAFLEIGDSAHSRKGLLLPRGNKDSVLSPVRGLLFYDVPSSKLVVYDNGWKESGGATLNYPNSTRRYINGFGSFSIMNSDSVNQGSTNLFSTTGEKANWNTAFSERTRWDGSSTGLNASTGRTSLGLGASATLNVANNLTTTGSGGSVLDAAQGKVLADMIGSIQSGSGQQIVDSIFKYGLNLYNGDLSTGTEVRIMFPVDTATAKIKLLDVGTNGALRLDSTADANIITGDKYTAGTNITFTDLGNRTYRISSAGGGGGGTGYVGDSTTKDFLFSHFTSDGNIIGPVIWDSVLNKSFRIRAVNGRLALQGVDNTSGGGGTGNYGIAVNNITYTNGNLSATGTVWCCAGSGGEAAGITSTSGQATLYMATVTDDNNDGAMLAFDDASIDPAGQSYGSQLFWCFRNKTDGTITFGTPDYHSFGSSTQTTTTGDTYGLRRNADNTIDGIIGHNGTQTVVWTYKTSGIDDVITLNLKLRAYISMTGTPIDTPKTNL